MFVYATLEDVARARRGVGLSLVQLHGDEGPVFCTEVARRTGARGSRPRASRSRPSARSSLPPDFHLLDTRARRPLRRHGQTWDWSLSTRASGARLLPAA